MVAPQTLSASADSDRSPTTLSRGAWLALIAALLGWMFDGAEMGVFSLVGRPAMQDLLGPGHEKDVARWLGVITGLFLVGAATGGVLFGWLGDRIGRVRAMTISVLTYALFTSLCGVVNSPFQLGAMRFIASLGMGGEWSLGVALVMEVFPNRSRAFMAGLIGAAANVGYLMVGIVGLGITNVKSQLEQFVGQLGLPEWLATRLVANDCWRVMMILGIVPALLTFFIRIFVPESEKWEQEREKGSTSNWATRDLLGVLLGALGPALMVYLYAFDSTTFQGREIFAHGQLVRLTAVVLGLGMAVLGYTYPVVRFLQRYRDSRVDGGTGIYGSTLRRMALAACLSGVALLGTWGATQQAPSWADKIAEAEQKRDQERLVSAGKEAEAQALTKPKAKEYMLIWLSVGAILGTLAAAFLGDLWGRRKAYFALRARLRLRTPPVPDESALQFVDALHGVRRGHLYGVVLRLAAAVPAGTLPHERARRDRGSDSTSVAFSPPLARSNLAVSSHISATACRSDLGRWPAATQPPARC